MTTPLHPEIAAHEAVLIGDRPFPVTKEELLAGFARLREPFPPEHIGKLPKSTKKDNPKGKCKPQRDGGDAPNWQDHFCGGWHGLPAVHLDYVGHGAVTHRLLEVDPWWTWTPSAGYDVDGQPMCVRNQQGHVVGLGIHLDVLGVVRYGYGSVEPGAFDAVKQLIGDALRNAARMFGVALDLWIKGQDVEPEVDSSAAPHDGGGRRARSQGHAPAQGATPASEGTSPWPRVLGTAAERKGLDAETLADFIDEATSHRTKDPAELTDDEANVVLGNIRALPTPAAA